MITIKNIIKKIIGRSNNFFMNQNKLYKGYDIGDWTYGNPKIYSFNKNTALKIGRFCSIAEGVIFLLGGEHRVDWVTTYPFNVVLKKASKFSGHPGTKGDIIIENDVWIGRDAIILSGVTIGNGAVVGARSVVTKNIEPYSIYAGNPARFIRYRFNESLIFELQKISWWNWNMDKIEEAWPLLLSNHIEEFIDIYANA